MGAWSRGVRIVRVLQGETPKPVTLVLPYYANPKFLQTQAESWRQYPDDLAAHLLVIVVDDGSPVQARLPAVLPCACRLFRIEQDVRWNWLAARNIGAHHAEDGWLLLTDMDHVVPEETLRSVIYGQHDPAVIYLFSRREHTGELAEPHSASFLMTRAMFWTVGGYDERLSGYYGTDGMFRRRCAETARLEILTDVLVRHEYQGDSSTTTYQRKQPEDARLQQLVASLPKGSQPTHLTFAYHEVTV